MSNYTEADVERLDARELNYELQGVPESLDQVARLKAAALEGAKVPGLVAALYEARENNDWKLAHAILDGKVHPVVALLANHQAEVSALNARVAALSSERDALRTLATEALEAIRTGGSGITRDIRIKLEAALSAPPVETTPAPVPAEDRCPRGDHAVWEHERDGKHPLCGTDAETSQEARTVTREQMARAMAETMWNPKGNAGAHYVDCCADALSETAERLGFEGLTHHDAPPAETTPAPECADVKCPGCGHGPHPGKCSACPCHPAE